MEIKNAKYKTSVVDKKNIIDDGIPEFAFVGRSNVGKSSLINRVCGIKNLAKTSSTPGLTKMINYFDINGGQFRFVDLPGYGYAKVGFKHTANWAGLMEEYLLNSESLKTVFVLVDCRHNPSELDFQMIEFLVAYNIPFAVVATKVDKLAKSKIKNTCVALAKSLKIREDIIIPFSSENGYGKERLLSYFDNIDV